MTELEAVQSYLEALEDELIELDVVRSVEAKHGRGWSFVAACERHEARKLETAKAARALREVMAHDLGVEP